MVVPRGLLHAYYPPPAARTIDQDRATLLVTYWCTVTSAVIIVMRIIGRYIRCGMLFRDDKIMGSTIILLLVHQAFVHVVLLFGTNNAAGTEAMSSEELRKREIGSGMVLGARVMFAAYVWSQKFCITEFYLRLTHQFWERSYEIGLRVIRWGLLVSFLAATISVFGECRPGSKLWQVTPDPGPQCRSGFAPLITGATFSALIDLCLVICPLPAIIRSSFTKFKKVRLMATVFSLSLFCIAIAGYRVPSVIARHGSQQYRSLLAAFEVLAATVVSNATVINSFARGRGAKKRKPSGDRGIDHSEGGLVRNAYWGSDADIARQVGGGRVPGIVPRQKGYGIDDRMEEIAPPPPARLHGVLPGRMGTWEFKNANHSGQITPPPSPLQIVHPELHDVGGLLRENEDNSTSSTSNFTSIGTAPTPSQEGAEGDKYPM